MKRLAVLLFAVLSLPALAETKEEKEKRLKEINAELQPKLAEANRQSCELAKANVAKHPDVCAEEHAKLGALDCNNAEARKASEFLKLSTACGKRASSKAKAAATEAVPCKAVDSSGTVLGEARSSGNYALCGKALEPVMLPKCTPELAGKWLKFTIQSTFMGKEKTSNGSVLCPRPKK